MLTLDELRAILGTCHRRSYDHQRDAAILGVLMNTGMRRGELAGLRYSPADPALRDTNLDRGGSRSAARARRGRICRVENTTWWPSRRTCAYGEQLQLHVHARGRLDRQGNLPHLRLPGRGSGRAAE